MGVCTAKEFFQAMEPIIPVRCFSCGEVVGDKRRKYDELVRSGETEKAALDKVGLQASCCRCMVRFSEDPTVKQDEYAAVKITIADQPIKWLPRLRKTPPLDIYQMSGELCYCR
jgi:DNA-directed RNA polymerase subunit N